MSRRNGDRARFQKERMRKMHRRQRIQALVAAVQQRKDAASGTRAGAIAHDGSRVLRCHAQRRQVRCALATEQTRPQVPALMVYRLLSSWRC